MPTSPGSSPGISTKEGGAWVYRTPGAPGMTSPHNPHQPPGVTAGEAAPTSAVTHSGEREGLPAGPGTRGGDRILQRLGLTVPKSSLRVDM